MQHMHGWAARKDRHSVEIDAVVQRPDGRKEAVKLSNFSDEGCRIEADEDFLIGERLQIAIPRMGQIKAQFPQNNDVLVVPSDEVSYDDVIHVLERIRLARYGAISLGNRARATQIAAAGPAPASSSATPATAGGAR